MISTFSLSLDARCALANARVAERVDDEETWNGLYDMAHALAREVGRAEPFERRAGALLAGEATLRNAWRTGQVDRLWEIIYSDAANSRRIADHMDLDTLHVESLRAYAAQTAFITGSSDDDYCGAVVDADTD